MQVSLERQAFPQTHGSFLNRQQTLKEFADWHRVSLVGYKPVSNSHKPTEALLNSLFPVWKFLKVVPKEGPHNPYDVPVHP